MHIIIGTRGSDLALWQARWVRERLAALGHTAELRIIKTQGDLAPEASFEKLEGKGFFTKEIEEALLRCEIDLAVHSLKDLPTSQPDGLCLAAITAREDPRDCLVIAVEKGTFYFSDQEPMGNQDAWKSRMSPFLPLKPNARVGTSSLRRRAQLLAMRPDLTIVPLRGNVPTRIRRVTEGKLDAACIALAGVTRLGLRAGLPHCLPLSFEEMLPAPGQGALALQIRTQEPALHAALQFLHDATTDEAVRAERGLLALLGGGCQLPLGAYAVREGNEIILSAFLGRRVVVRGVSSEVVAERALQSLA